MKNKTPNKKRINYLVICDDCGNDPFKECYTMKEVEDHIKGLREDITQDDFETIRVYEVTGKVGKIKEELVFA